MMMSPIIPLYRSYLPVKPCAFGAALPYSPGVQGT
jgi:hypothetical protein